MEHPSRPCAVRPPPAHRPTPLRMARPHPRATRTTPRPKRLQRHTPHRCPRRHHRSHLRHQHARPPDLTPHMAREPGIQREQLRMLPSRVGTRRDRICAYNLAVVIARLTKVCVFLAAVFGARAGALPSADEILKRVLARMEAVCEESPTNRFHYIRTNVVEELDGGNKVNKRTVKTYEVQQSRGFPQSKLLVVDGRALKAAEQKWRIADEQRLQRTLTQDKTPDYSKPKPWLTEGILERFTFTVTGRTNRMRRSVLMLEFKPQPNAPNRNMADRVVNKISGALWVDESDSEIVRLDLNMNEPVKFWGGILGQLDRFEWTLLRRRSPFGVWFNESSNGMVQIRKLFTSTRFRISEESF